MTLSPDSVTTKEAATAIANARAITKPACGRYFDFGDPDHLDHLVTQWRALERAKTPGSSIERLLDTFLWYADQTCLNEVQRFVLEWRMAGKQMVALAEALHKELGVSYNGSYLSVYWRLRVLTPLANTAKYHRELVLSLDNPDAFLTCNTCGRSFPATPVFFTRSSRTDTGFLRHCKECGNRPTKIKLRPANTEEK